MCMKILWALFLNFKLTKWAQFYTAYQFYFIGYYILLVNYTRGFARIVRFVDRLIGMAKKFIYAVIHPNQTQFDGFFPV